VMIVEFVLNVVQDGVVGRETMGCQRIALRPVGSDDQRRAGDFPGIGAYVGVGSIADARA
jgi:hypothetical protein